MAGTQISDMTNSLTDFPDGAYVPFVVTDSATGLDPSINYVFDAGQYLAKYSALAASTGANLVGTIQSGTGAVARTLEEKNSDILSDADYSSLQNLVNAADTQTRQGVVLGGTTTISSPLSLLGLTVELTGIANRSMIEATGTPSYVIDVTESSEVSYSPFQLSNLFLDGSAVTTNAVVSVRYRRNYVLENLFVRDAPRGIRVKDGNSGFFYNIRTNAVTYGFHSEGSNHNSVHIGVSANGASAAGLLIEANGSAIPNDGNHALGFYNFHSQDCTGDNIRLNYRTSADLFSGYLGEGTDGFAVNNSGGVIQMRGGIAFFDHSSTNYLVKPIGSGANGERGLTVFNGTRIAASSTNGLSKLIGLASGEVDLQKNGKVRLQDVDLYCLTSGGGFFNGDVIDCAPTTNGWVPRNGRAWTADSNGASSTSISGNAHTISSTGASLIGFYASINSSFWRTDGPLYFIMCYQSDKPVIVATMTAPQAGDGDVLGSAPATSVPGTWIVCDVTPTLFTGIDTLQIFTNLTAVSGDEFTLYRAGLADADFVNSGGRSGVLCNLYYP